MLSKAQVKQPFKFFCAHKIVKKRGFPHALEKLWITTDILRSMPNKEKLHKMYLIQKNLLINKVLHEIFKRNKNIIKKTPEDTQTDYFTHYFIQGQNDMKRTWKKIIQITNVNKRFTAFPTMMKHENHTIDNIAKISENSNDFLRSLVKSLKIKFLHPMSRSIECYHS